MKAVCFQDINVVECREIAEPVLENHGDAIVQIELAGLCGSDLHPFFGRELGLDPGTVMGHEFVGQILEVGQDVRSFKAGDRVFAPFSTSCGNCFYCSGGLTSRCEHGQLFGWRSDGVGLHGGQAERVRVPLADGTLMLVPPEMTAETALLLGDNFSTGYYCAEMASVNSTGTFVIVGCGTVGVMAVLAAKSMGAKNLLVLDQVKSRLEIAEKHGAESFTTIQEVNKRVAELTDGRGADAVMELVGLPEAMGTSFKLLRPGGILSVIGCHCTPDFSFSPVDAYNKNLTYRTGRCPARHYMQGLSERAATGEFKLDAFITHYFAMEDCKEAYDVFSQRKNGCLKAAFRI